MLKTASLKADNAVDIINMLAEHLNTSTEKDNNEYCFDILENMGSGYIKAINFDSGISIIEADVLLNKSLNLEFRKETLNPLVIMLNIESPILHHISSSDENLKIERFESLMFSNDMKDYHSITIKENTPTSFIKIYINRKEFESKLSDFLDDLSPDLETLFMDLNGVNLFHYNGHYSLGVSEALDEIKNCEQDGLMRSMFIESKVYEILTLHFQQYSDDLEGPEGRKILRRSTMDKIEKAATLVKNEMATTCSVNQLAKKVGLNQNTLQAGFQHMFNSSVNDYVRTKRIEKAKELIETTDLNITEITYNVGINSRSYFSKLFKEKYKLTPKQYLKRYRNSKTA
ncbi:helix-turn-helix domain-containing protein [Winogradskyella ursingii]|uniref:helix-turn-helix domain-containing protein n=1 Tax=Winogradskyella ursingii TaxID=2686079 RepID=UPI0015C84376|nr:AraC family transcriptional regulator [Winogradskyella ursingii]